MFYFVAIALCLLAAGFVLIPGLMARRPGKRLSHNEAVRSIYQERLDELADDAAAAADELDGMRDELGAVLLSEHQDEPQSPAATRRQGRMPWLVAALCVPLLGFFTYEQLSDASIMQVRGAEVVLHLPASEKSALEGWQKKLEARVAAAPEDSKSWYLLGHVGLKLERFDSAAQAFATTNDLVKEDINVQIYWLQARYLAARGVLDDVSREIADKLLAQQPNLPVVLEILALDAFRREDHAAAITMLNRTMTSTRDVTKQASLASAIRQMRDATTARQESVTVDVSATDSVPKHATVFAIARPVGGGMPYAVVKRPAIMLPFEVALDDLVAMNEVRKLSDADAYEVVIRLSESGQALPREGDWQWVSDPLAPSSEPQRLVATLTPP